jgi:methylsterol monooxygenase
MSSNPLQGVWDLARSTSWGQDERWLFVLSFYLVHNVHFWGTVLVYALIDHFGILDKYKIQKDKYPDKKLLKKAVFDLFLSHWVLFIPLQYFLVFPVIKYFKAIKSDPVLPPLTDLLWQIPAFMVCEDTVFFWFHRTLHHRLLYKYIHKQHHEFKVTVGLAAEYSSPLEALTNLVATISGPFIFKAHLVPMLIWFVFRVTESMDAHCGYRIPWSPFQMLDNLQGGPERHDYHHSHNIGSYGSWFCFWDWFTGSDQSYRAYQITSKDEAAKSKFDQATRSFSLNLENSSEQNIVKSLLENLKKNPEDSWKNVSLNGTALTLRSFC